MTKEKWIDILKTFVFAVLAGVSISIGCIANLASNSAVIGAIFFCVGLFTILIFLNIKGTLTTLSSPSPVKANHPDVLMRLGSTFSGVHCLSTELPLSTQI